MRRLQWVLILVLAPVFIPGGVLADEVPLPATPDWQADLERAVGGMAWIDANNDGWQDLAVGCYWANAYPPIIDYYNYIYMNLGGTLETTPSWMTTAERHTTDLYVIDINNDDYDDLFVANGGESLQPSVIYFGSAGGLSNSPGWFSADATWTIGCDFGDVDGDGDLDLATANQGNSADPTRPVYIFANTGGALSTTPTWASNDLGISNSVHFGDADGDDNLDLAVSKWVNWPTGVYYNTGGGLNATQGWSTGEPNRSDKGIGWADVDGDGVLELAVGGNSAPCQLFENPGTGPVTPAVWESADSYHGCQELFWCDIDEDNDPDLFTVNFGNGHARVYLNNEGVLSTTADWTYDCSSSATAIAVGDMNRDGHLDLAVATARQPVMVFLNTLPSSSTPGVNTDLFSTRLIISPQPSRGSVSLRRPGLPLTDPGQVVIYRADGREVVTLPLSGGRSEIQWDGLDARGLRVGSGVYLVKWIQAHQATAGRILMLK
ncbi:MAG: VCBS repeat-containing protein [Candidatus Eisenbacteria bacterium]|uniref:VCBS repeat-containing protein n=1 Tax=Eiseniibacteriota bacterium TaxID=2212470 RepID=A0A948RYS6_UNCEI|nr:VCBS repeat-containing protein [Candidatus Eisenbacteria bacterium]MBU1949565.1 VCBS repeat-containing protein [Candidatus Eisenbacteria bacterium]MBU2692098.1 VCBS repeat-containing protein [Candidatus Eisenbacteria bacterium]